MATALPTRTVCRWALCAAIGSLNLGAFAQATTAPAAPAARDGSSGMAASLSRSDRDFIEKAVQGAMAEVELGRLAQQHAASPLVKSFGERMAQDHAKANLELTRLATARSVQVPTTMGREQRRDADRLARLAGAPFDRAYMQHMVEDHRHDVSLFEKQARSAQDAELKAFAAKTLPTLKAHLELAQSTYDSVRNERVAGTAPPR